MEVHPLLFITSPSFIQEKLDEESTSVYVRPEPEKIENPLVARQLHYFAKPSKEPRVLLFILASGERICASIEQIAGCNVLVNCVQTKRWIHANDIVMIQHTL